MVHRHRHLWLLRDGYLRCGICGKVKIQRRVYPSLYDFVLEFLEDHFSEIFGGLIYG
jgi:hypothetical protein